MQLSAEHLNHCRRLEDLSGIIEASQPLNEPALVHGTQMIDCHTKDKPALSCRQWCHDYREQRLVHFRRRNNNAGASLLDLGAKLGIESNEIYVKLLAYHVHSFSSHSELRGASSQSRSSSVSSLPCSATAALIDSAQPARGRSAPAGVIMTWLFDTLISTLSLRPTWSITDFGNRTPRELPRAGAFLRPSCLERGLVFMISIVFAALMPDKAASTIAA
jgi:hypothetical protein